MARWAASKLLMLVVAAVACASRGVAACAEPDSASAAAAADGVSDAGLIGGAEAVIEAATAAQNGTAPAAAKELFHYGLPGPIYPFHLFPKLQVLVDNWERMRDEAVKIKHDMNLLRTSQVFDDDSAMNFLKEVIKGGNNGWTTAWTQDRGWKNYGLVQWNKPFPGVTDQLCPFTVGLLTSIPGMRIGGFSKLLPNKRIETHVDNAGLSHGSVAAHVYLTGHARMRIDDIWVEHIPGNALVFDGNINHEVINGPEERIILYVELGIEEFFMGTEGVRVLKPQDHE